MADSIMEVATKEMADSKRALLLAGLDLFSKKGVDGVSTGDLSKITGFSRPVIFKFYKTKLDMAVEIFTICYRGLQQKLKPIVDSKADFPNKLTFFCEQVARVIVDDSDSLFMVSENIRLLLPRAKGLDIKNSILSLTIELVKSGQQEKLVDKELSAEDMGIAIIGVIQQMARIRYFSEQKKSTKVLAETLHILAKRIFGLTKIKAIHRK